MSTGATEPVLICAGEAVIDMIARDQAFHPVPGGAALNAACAAARQGARVEYLGALSTDALGERLASKAADEGVGLDLCLRTDAPTPISIAHLTGGDARFTIYHEGTAAQALTALSLPALPAATRVLLVGGFSLIHSPSADAFEALALACPDEVVLVIDLNVRPSLIRDAESYRARLRRIMARADIVKASDEDLAWLGPYDQGTETLLLHSHGAGGATACYLGKRVHVAARPGDIVDTVGAGDVFIASWLAHGLATGTLRPDNRTDMHKQLHYAVTAASLSTRSTGASGPTREEVLCAL